MATLTFTDDPVAEARSIVSALTLWLSEQPKPETAPPAHAHCTYTEDGKLKSLTVTLGDD